MGQQIIDRDAIEEAAYDADIDAERDIIWEYGGRGMYGTSCVAIRASTPKELATFFYVLTRMAIENPDGNIIESTVADMAQDTQEDSMGRGIVYYWPSFTAVEEV